MWLPLKGKCRLGDSNHGNHGNHGFLGPSGAEPSGYHGYRATRLVRGTDAGVARAGRFGDVDAREEEAQLRVKQRDVAAAEDFGHQRPARPQDVRRDVHGGQQQLRLHVLVHVVQPRH